MTSKIECKQHAIRSLGNCCLNYERGWTGVDNEIAIASVMLNKITNSNDANAVKLHNQLTKLKRYMKGEDVSLIGDA